MAHPAEKRNVRDGIGAAHLEHQPRNGFIAPRGIGWQTLIRFLREIDQQRAAFEQAERLSAPNVGIDDGRDLAVRIERKKFRRVRLVRVNVQGETA
jgi:hypothetical protein